MHASSSLLDPPNSVDEDTPDTPERHRAGGRHAYERAPDERINKLASITLLVDPPPGPLGSGVVRSVHQDRHPLVVLFFGRMWFITAGYRQLLRAAPTGPAVRSQFVLAFSGATAAQKGPLWWAGHHRNHHRDSDTERDVHSPLRGFWWSHVGWILCDKYDEIPVDRIKDFARYPELRFVDKYNGIAPWIVGIASYLVAGWAGLTVGFFLSTVLLWHNTFS